MVVLVFVAVVLALPEMSVFATGGPVMERAKPGPILVVQRSQVPIAPLPVPA